MTAGLEQESIQQRLGIEFSGLSPSMRRYTMQPQSIDLAVSVR
jgi:hypothetical protein